MVNKAWEYIFNLVGRKVVEIDKFSRLNDCIMDAYSEIGDESKDALSSIHRELEHCCDPIREVAAGCGGMQAMEWMGDVLRNILKLEYLARHSHYSYDDLTSRAEDTWKFELKPFFDMLYDLPMSDPEGVKHARSMVIGMFMGKTMCHAAENRRVDTKKVAMAESIIYMFDWLTDVLKEE